MDSDNQIPAEIREQRGKGASRRLRRAGLVPAILYGGDRDPVSLQLPATYLQRMARNESFFTSILELSVDDGRKQRVILRDLQRHPAKDLITHVDFQRISETEELRIVIPLNFVGEDQSPAGQTGGVVIAHQITEVEITCLPKDLPESIEVDLSSIDVGDTIHLSEIRFPDGVESVILAAEGDLDPTVVTAQHVQVVADEEEEDAEVVEGEEAEAAEDADEDGGDAGEAEGDDADES